MTGMGFGERDNAIRDAQKKRNAYKTAWREANREKVLEQQRARRAENPDRSRAHQAAYRASNSEKIREYNASYLTRTRSSWRAMLTRCLNPKSHNYPRYGASGIQVCDRWLKFENFLEDMGERPDGKTIDRINNDGNYEPSNCRWATPLEQAANRRPRKKNTDASE